jgi:putative alpha-1,2-mannosidase
VVGFAQLHTQGTGGTPTYGNFLVSPRLGRA